MLALHADTVSLLNTMVNLLPSFGEVASSTKTRPRTGQEERIPKDLAKSSTI